MFAPKAMIADYDSFFYINGFGRGYLLSGNMRMIAFYEVWAQGPYIYITGDHCNRGSAPYSEVSVQ
jgi:hypothetical protein